MFPSMSTQILSFLIHSLGITVLTHCLSRRLAVDDLRSWKGLSRLSWPRICILGMFLDSWAFLFSSGILIFGLGLEPRQSMCSGAVDVCIVFYATSKIFLYAFLIERVHVVWSPISGGRRRFSSPVYVVSFLTVGLYTMVICLMFVGRKSYFRASDGACVIGLKPIASIPLLSYDLYINVLLTLLFLWPLFSTKLSNPRLRRVAIRTLIASGIALTTSAANIAVLASLRGEELGWICLGSCGADVIFNAFALFWVTIPSESHGSSASLEEDIHLEHVTIAGLAVQDNLSLPQTPMAQKQTFSDLLSQSSTVCDSHSFLSIGKDAAIRGSPDSSDQLFDDAVIPKLAPSEVLGECRVSISIPPRIALLNSR